jgi:hypothetical protein
VNQDRSDRQRLSADHCREQSRAFEHTHEVFLVWDAQGNGKGGGSSVALRRNDR